MFPASPRILSATESFASQAKYVKIGDFHGPVSGETFEKIMKAVREDSKDSGRDKMTSKLTTKDSGLLRVMEERTFSTPEDVAQRNRDAIGYARNQQDDQIKKLY